MPEYTESESYFPDNLKGPSSPPSILDDPLDITCMWWEKVV